VRIDALESSEWELQATLQFLYQVVGPFDDAKYKWPFHGVGAQHVVDQFVHVLDINLN